MLARLRPWLRRTLVALLVAAAAATAFAYALARSRLPRLDGSARLAGLGAAVTVRRDELGVPHIDAQAELDAWAAVGFVHAQDRFFQMDLARRSIAGRLAEVVGAPALGFDREARRLQLAAVARSQLELLAPAEQEALAAYARGVNQGLADTGRPVECLVLGYRPEPWQPLDTLLVLKYVEELLAGDGGERTRLLLGERLGPEVASYLLDFHGMEGATILPALADDGLASPPAAARDRAPDGEPAAGSNAWVVSGARTASGKPLLANDTHLPLGAPAIFYQIHVRFPGADAAGMSVPGAPYPVLGHNGRVAWGVTALGADQIDYVELTLDPADPDRYRVAEGWARFELRRERIAIKGGGDESMVVKWSRFGPVIDERPGAALARSWVPYQAGDGTVRAVRALVRTASASDLLAVTRDWSSPALSILAADVAGHLAYRAAALLPRRGAGDGSRTLRGEDPCAGWEGFLPADTAPAVLDPPGGLVVSANNRVGSGRRAALVSTSWAPPYRADRITELLAGAAELDVAAMERVQLDVVSTVARRLVAALPAGPLADAATDPWWQRLRAWDGSFRRGAEPTVYDVFERELRCAVLEDDAGPDCRWGALGLLKATGAYRFAELPAELAGRDWIDDRRTPAREDVTALVTRALSTALDRLRKELGAEEAGWDWSQLHTATLGHPLGSLPLVGSRFNLGPFPVAGSVETVNANAGSRDRRHAVVHGPVMRMVIDLGDLARSRIVNSTGQSGHFLSPHYRDQAAAWAEGRSFPLRYGEEEIAASTRAALRLEP